MGVAQARNVRVSEREDAVYISQKNDCAVCVQSSLALFEQQSSWNPNMPLRGFLYFAAEYAGWLARHKKDVHSKGLVKIPAPSYYVLYNGTDRNMEMMDLRLSDAFEKSAEGYEWTAHVVNVNAGHNTAILGRCKLLGQYAQFIADIRQEQKDGLSPEDAVDAAVEACIGRGGKLAEFMRKHKAEVNFMYLFGVDFEKIHQEAMIEEARNEGLAAGRKADARNMLADGMPMEKIIQYTSLPLEEVEKLAAAETEPVLA